MADAERKVERIGRLSSVMSIKPFRAVLLTLVLSLPVWWLTGQWYRDRLLWEERAHISGALLPHANALSSSINQRLALLDGLSAFTHIEHTDAELAAHFVPLAKKLEENVSGIRALNVGANGIVRFIYPLAGNEGAMGHDVMTDPRPEVKAAVERTIRTKKTALNGPFELRQGGLGLIGRQAIYEGDAFWGLTAIVLDIPPILHEAGLDRPFEGMRVALSDDAGKVFYGDEAVLASAPVTYRMTLVDGAWTIAAIPERGWSASVFQSVTLFRGVGLTLISLFAILVALVANRQASLTELVAQRTSTLEKEVIDHRRAEEALRANEEKLTVVLAASQKAEAEAKEQLEIIQQQKEAIRTLSTPILQVWDGVLALPVLGTLDAARAASMMAALLEAVARTRARQVILDLTGVETIDAATADHVVKLIMAVGLLGARGIVTGIRPNVARSICGVDADISRLTTLANMQSALLYCMRIERA